MQWRMTRAGNSLYDERRRPRRRAKTKRSATHPVVAPLLLLHASLAKLWLHNVLQRIEVPLPHQALLHRNKLLNSPAHAKVGSGTTTRQRRGGSARPSVPLDAGTSRLWQQKDSRRLLEWLLARSSAGSGAPREPHGCTPKRAPRREDAARNKRELGSAAGPERALAPARPAAVGKADLSAAHVPAEACEVACGGRRAARQMRPHAAASASRRQRTKTKRSTRITTMSFRARERPACEGAP